MKKQKKQKQNEDQTKFEQNTFCHLWFILDEDIGINVTVHCVTEQ